MDEHSVTGHSDMESSASAEYQVTPSIWLEKEE